MVESSEGFWLKLGFDATVDAGRFEHANHDGEVSRSINFLQKNDLIVANFANDDPRKLHLNRHNTLPDIRKPITESLPLACRLYFNLEVI